MPVYGRNRVADEAGKGIEALRMVPLDFGHNSTALTPVRCIAFDVDVDIVEVILTAGIIPADNATNVVTVFNGTVAANKPIIAHNYSSATGVPFVAQVPVSIPVDGTTPPTGATVTTNNRRVTAGTPISVQAVFGGTDTNASLSVQIFYEIPIYDQSGGANVTVGGTYNRNW